MFEIVPLERLGAVFPDEYEALDELEEIDFFQCLIDAVGTGMLTEAEAREMVVREEELNAIRRA